MGTSLLLVAATRIGVVVAIKTNTIYIGHLTPGKTDDNWLIPENHSSQTWRVHWDKRRESKMDVLRDLLPPAPSPLFQTYLTRIFARWLYLKTFPNPHRARNPSPLTNRSFLNLAHPDFTKSPHGLKYPKTRRIFQSTSSINHSFRYL